MQHSIFEPLYSFQAPMEAHLQAQPSAFSQANLQGSSCLLTLPPAPPSSSSYIVSRGSSTLSSDHSLLPCKDDLSNLYLAAAPCTLHAGLITPSFSSFPKKSSSEQDLTSDLTHLQLPLPHSSTLPATRAPTCSNDDRNVEDGSIASKLLSSITKSISSPSLQLASCKESARESPYQKTLKLKQMKLQHCTEAIGMESWDASSVYDSQYIQHEKLDLIGSPSAGFSSFSSSFTLPKLHQESSIISVKSAPNLSAPHLMTSPSRYTRCVSFPPPLSHTLPVSPSCDSLSPSLRPYRQDGRFILKEVMVPSKHYFHANRRNGRLTLHVFTRELDEDEENFTSQNDQESSSFNASQSSELINVKQKEILEGMVSLYQETLEEGYGNKEVGNTDIIQSLDEKGSEKKHVDIVKVGMDDFSKFSTAAINLMSLDRLQCIAVGDDDNADESNDEGNAITNVITLSLQTSDHSKVSVHKAQVLSSPLFSSSLKKSTFIHPHGESHGLLSSHHDMRTISPSMENFTWESSLMPCVAASHLQSIQRGGGGGRGDTTPAFVLEEMSAKSVMRVVSDLATSSMLEASFAGGNWCLAGGKRKPSLSGVGSEEISDTKIGAYSAMNSAIMDGGMVGHHQEEIVDHGGVNANPGYKSHDDDEERGSNTEGCKEMATSKRYFDLKMPSSSANLQCDEWLHTLHCKELLDRHHLGKGFMKLHCIATRS